MDPVLPQEPGPRSVIVIGGGLAGVAAACSFTDYDFQVTLLEKRPFLGGRVFSFLDREAGHEIDNGQHVFMKCCTAYVALLEQLGALEKTAVQPYLRVEVRDGARRSALYRVALPSPFHLLPSLVTYRHLSWREKLLVLYAALKILRTRRRKSPALQDITFYQWLKRHRQSERAIKALWDLIVLPTCNDDAAHVSADQAIMVFQEGFLRHSDGADIGYATVGLSSLLDREAQEYISAGGGSVLTGQGAERLLVEGGRVTGVRLSGGQALRARYVVSAVPFHVLPSLLPEELRATPFFADIGRLQASPIVNVHLWYDAPILDRDFVAFLSSEVQFLFNKSRMWRLPGPEQYVCVSMSGAHGSMGLEKEEVFRRVSAELQRLLPAARKAKVLRWRVVKERAATFTPGPGARAWRRGPETPVPNLFLAGEWTATDWPSTMESAVRSGVAAVRAVVRAYVARPSQDLAEVARMSGDDRA